MIKKMPFHIEEVLAYIRERTWMIVCGMLLGKAVFLAISFFILKPEYESNISLYISNAVNTTLSSTMNLNDITASQQLVNTYIALLKDESVYSEISRQLVNQYTYDELESCFSVLQIGDTIVIRSQSLRDCITMEAEENTEVLNIKVKTRNPRISADVCGFLSNTASNVFKTVIQAGNVNEIGSIKVNTESVSPDPVEMGIAGAGAGIMSAVFWILLLFVMDTKIHTVAEFGRRCPIPVLGMIPKC